MDIMDAQEDAMQFNRPDMINHRDATGDDVSEHPVETPAQLEPLPPQDNEKRPIVDSDIDRGSSGQTGQPYSVGQALAQEKGREQQ